METQEIDVGNSQATQVRHSRGKITTADGLELFWQSWRPEQSLGVIVLIHGLAEHSGRYTATAKHFAGHGWAIYACDLRGHGLSPDGHKPGRVHVDDFDDYALDVDAILGLARKRHPGLPCVILGHSMGGLISLRYAIRHPDELDGAVISSPGLGVHPDTRLPRLLELAVRVLSRLSPRLLFPSDLDTNAISRDPAVVRAYDDDPLVSGKVSARWYTSITRAMADIQAQATELRVPTLLMQSGADTLVDPETTRRWAAKVPVENIEFVMWDGLYHEMFNEPEKHQVRARVVDWLQKLVVVE